MALINYNKIKKKKNWLLLAPTQYKEGYEVKLMRIPGGEKL